MLVRAEEGLDKSAAHREVLSMCTHPTWWAWLSSYCDQVEVSPIRYPRIYASGELT